MTFGTRPDRRPWPSSASLAARSRLAAGARRIGIAFPLLLLAAALPPPQGASIAGLPSFCGFHRLTGLPCPGCGITRSLVCCAHGLWAEAVGFHPLGPLVFAALVGAAVVHLASSRWPRIASALPPRWIAGACWAGVFALAVVWGARLAGMIPSPP